MSPYAMAAVSLSSVFYPSSARTSCVANRDEDAQGVNIDA